MEDQPQESPNIAPNVASIIGAEALTPLRTDLMKSCLTYFIEKQSPVSVPNFDINVGHDVYLSTRQGIVRSVILSAVAGSPTLEHFIQELEKLQRGYARQVIAEINNGIKDQKDYLAIAEEELRQGEQTRAYFELLGERPAKTLTRDEFSRLVSLNEEIEKLDKTEKTRIELHRVVEGISRVDNTLTTLIESGRDCIHYIIPSVKEAQDKLGDNTYDAPIFDPIRVTNAAEVRDIFLRNVSTPLPIKSNKKGINFDRLPPILSDLVKMYTHVLSLPPGVRIVPKHLKDQLNMNSLSTRAVASYLEKSQEICGVKMEDDSAPIRTFVRRESGIALNADTFLRHILNNNMPPEDVNAVNSDQFEKALMLLRDTQEGYNGFTSETLSNLANSHGLVVSRMYISINLNKSISGVTCIKEKKGLTLAEYRFSEVIPTPTQINYTDEAVREFGISRFEPFQIRDSINGRHPDYKISRRVVEEVLRSNHASMGLRIASDNPLQYQKKSTEGEAKPTLVTKGNLM